jgi:AcrR family transcriptional regulator
LRYGGSGGCARLLVTREIRHDGALVVDCVGAGHMSAGKAGRPVRRDVARNRARLIEAAREVFAKRGLDATLDDIARHAGVGTGTTYRHFANKQELAAALFADSSEQIVIDAQVALTIDDPWEGLVAFFQTSAERQAADRGLHQVLMGHQLDGDPLGTRERLIDAVARLFERARSAGVIRADAEPTDAAAIFSMLGVAYDMSAATHPDLWRRYLALLLDGLRATDRPPLPAGALPLDLLDVALAAAKPRQSRGDTPSAQLDNT